MKTIRKGNDGSKVLQGKWLGCVLALLMVLVPATEAFAAQVALDVSKAGSGAGTVTSSPPGIDCGSVCLASYETLHW